MTFTDMKIIPPILKALGDENYTAPTPIQEQAIPAILAGTDLLGCAQTGTGKTAAFAVPILQLLIERPSARNTPRRIRSLILTPTRELALQIHDNIESYARYTDIRCSAIYGGVSQKTQERALNQGVDILVATPGRLIDLMNQKYVDLKYIEIFVLDEADRMLDMGFIHDVKKITSQIPAKKQTLLFSATMPTEISTMVKSILVNPVKVEITPVSSTASQIEQFVYFVDKGNKQQLLAHLLEDKSITSALVFTRTKHGANRVVRELSKANIQAQAIHGDKSQSARQLALSNFKSGVTRVLVATDIAARGIDNDELSHVINFNLPNISETYVHRIGRTGRAGMSGIAISFCEIEEMPFFKDIEKLIGKSIPEVKGHPYPMLITTEPIKPTGANNQQSSKAGPTKPRQKASNDQKPYSGANKYRGKSSNKSGMKESRIYKG